MVLMVSSHLRYWVAIGPSSVQSHRQYGNTQHPCSISRRAIRRLVGDSTIRSLDGLLFQNETPFWSECRWPSYLTGHLGLLKRFFISHAFRATTLPCRFAALSHPSSP